MKKIIFISTSLLTLLAVGVCKGAAGPDASWHRAVPNDWQAEVCLNLSNQQITVIPGNFNAPRLERLYLNNNQITAIPDTLQLDELRYLNLSNNNIQEINPKRLLEQFPRLERIDLSGNTYLDERFIQDLRDEADKAGRGDTFEIIAKNIAVGRDIKG